METKLQNNNKIKKIDVAILAAFFLINFISVGTSLLYSTKEYLNFALFYFDLVIFTLLFLYRIISSIIDYKKAQKIRNYDQIISNSSKWLDHSVRLQSLIKDMRSSIDNLKTSLETKTSKDNLNEVETKINDAILGVKEVLEELKIPIAELKVNSKQLLDISKSEQSK